MPTEIDSKDEALKVPNEWETPDFLVLDIDQTAFNIGNGADGGFPGDNAS